MMDDSRAMLTVQSHRRGVVLPCVVGQLITIEGGSATNDLLFCFKNPSVAEIIYNVMLNAQKESLMMAAQELPLCSQP